ncbi:Wzz/FepE/Etk N-terminal domain-containing protein (plasmid) [Phyllobacterium sp. A18/5-2]|uniref:GNVR domain-containing protein n=1 Tax=Phyllobacterium sp. A18/5-2 TaxID=2978392 RepID=UPI0021C60A4D|nr:GNVR domain-containing protein [Phyllobacterium sp. A18/5-2]UXN66282.1 Wzz/FepE/Etk N-terminal domain-containing protein [Phyllobacterium sp. A18/5-2]
MTTSHTFSGVSSISLPAATTGGSSPLTLREVRFFLRMRWQWIVATTSAFLAVAGFYVLTTEPTFVASTQLLVFPQVNGSESQRAFAEDTFLEAQLEIAKSSDVFSETASALDLVSDPAFAHNAPSLLETTKDWLMGTLPHPAESDEVTGAAVPESVAEGTVRSQQVVGTSPNIVTGQSASLTEMPNRSDRVVARLRNIVALRRIGRSTILEISAAASSPKKAVAIADTMAKEYIRKNILMKAQAARQYSEWLEKFLIEQQRGLTDAANDLASFKSNPRDQFKLVELQSAAAARRTLYENTLTQFTEAKQRISYPVSDATIVSPATSPLSKARPRSGLIVAFATVVGASAGVMLAMIRHAGDRRIVRAQRFAEATGLPFVTSLGRSEKSRNGRTAWFLAAEAGSGSTATYPIIPGMAELSTMIAGVRRKRKMVIIGIVAINPGSGASTIACELAVLTAESGSRTLLIDAAAEKSSLSRSIAPHSSVGLIDVLDNAHLLDAAALPITPTLKFLPLGRMRGVTPAIRLSSRRTQLNFDDLKKNYDAVFVDISPISESPDANAIAPELDGVLVVTRHGHTSIDEAVRVIDELRNVGVEVLGAVINKAPLRMQS